MTMPRVLIVKNSILFKRIFFTKSVTKHTKKTLVFFENDPYKSNNTHKKVDLMAGI